MKNNKIVSISYLKKNKNSNFIGTHLRLIWLI